MADDNYVIGAHGWERYALNGERFNTIGSDRDKLEQAKAYVKTAIEKGLGYTFEVAVDRVTYEQLEKLGCINAIKKYFEVPSGVDIKRDTDWIVSYAFNKEYDYKTFALRLYKRIRNGKLRGFPRNYFEGMMGKRKAAVILRDFISTDIVAHDMNELYELFASRSIYSALDKAGLADVCTNYYASPLDFLHESLSPSERSTMLYNIYSYYATANYIHANKQNARRREQRRIERQMKTEQEQENEN